MSVQLRRRWPVDYFYSLPRPGQKTVVNRVKKAYANVPRFAEDCAQEACTRLLAFRDVLKAGPVPTPSPSSEWYSEAEGALVRFAAGRIMRRAVFRDTYSENGIELTDDEIDRIVGPTSEDTKTGPRRIEEQLHWSRVVEILRSELVDQANVDVETMHVFDQLCGNVQDFERCYHDWTDSSAREDVFRGESFQINQAPLLDTLQRNYPNGNWDIDKVKLKIANLCRNAERLKGRFADRGLLPFSANRARTGTAERRFKKPSETLTDDPTGAATRRGILS